MADSERPLGNISDGKRRYTIKWDAPFCFDTEVWFDTDEEAIEYVRQVDGPLRQMFNDKNEMIYDE